MKKAPAFQFYADDFLGGVADMTQAEVGAYILLLCAQWNRGEIPVDAARAGLIAKGEVSAHVLAKFPGGKNPRMEAVRKEQQAYREKQSEKGKASAQARLKRTSTTVEPRLNHGSAGAPTEAQPEANPPSPSPSPINTPLPPKGGEATKVKAKGPLQLRAERLMRRRESTPLTAAETRAFAKNRPAIEATTEDDWQALEAFYAAPQEVTFARKDLATLLNNWNGEIDRAKAWVGQQKPAGTPVSAIPPTPEPIGWREWVAANWPQCDYAPGQPRDGAAWDAMPAADARAIAQAMKKAASA